MGITIFGWSDDCLEIRDDLHEEVYVSCEEATRIELHPVAVVELSYNQDAEWEIKPLSNAERVHVQEPGEHDHCGYSQAATVGGVEEIIIDGHDEVLSVT